VIFFLQEGKMLIDLLRKRRSVRRFEERPVEEEKIDILIESVLRSPSSRGLNPWEFVVVRDKEMLTRLAQAKPHGASFIKNAPLAFVVCADPARCDVWVEDCSIAAILLHLAATDLGLGSCWVQIRLREHGDGRMAQDYVTELLGLKAGMVVEAIIAIGYPADELPGHPRASLLDERVSFERYGEGKLGS
jgi:nitroreductase